MTGLDDIIRRALSSFAAEALDGSWNGRREREAVSLFVFGHLLRHVGPSSFLHDPTQIGIEVPVPQVVIETNESNARGSARKLQVCKDVVIWPRPRMTCWDSEGKATVAPAAILEWKFNFPYNYHPDLVWLKEFSIVYPGFIGYSVTANPPGRDFKLSCIRIADGDGEVWLILD